MTNTTSVLLTVFEDVETTTVTGTKFDQETGEESGEPQSLEVKNPSSEAEVKVYRVEFDAAVSKVLGKVLGWD